MARVMALSLNPALDLSVRLEQLHPGLLNRAAASHMTPAGKGNNVARALAALGHEITVTGFLGADNTGVFEQGFADWQVQDAFVRVAGETRINIKLAEDAGRVTDVNAAGMPISPADWQCLQQVIDDQIWRAPDAVVIAGSLPPGVAPVQLASLIERLRGRGIPVWLDTSGAALAAGLKSGPVAVKPNIEELSEYAGRTLHDEADCIAAAQALHAVGVADLFVSMGADGVLWCTPDGVLRSAPPAVSVVSTVCAGDTLLAGLLHGRLSGWNRERMLRFATALSADAVRRIGVGEASAPDFDALCAQVRIEPVQPDRQAASV